MAMGSGLMVLNSTITTRKSHENVLLIYFFHVGIVDWGEVARHYGSVFSKRGGSILLGFQVNNVSPYRVILEWN